VVRQLRAKVDVQGSQFAALGDDLSQRRVGNFHERLYKSYQNLKSETIDSERAMGGGEDGTNPSVCSFFRSRSDFMFLSERPSM
jgi:hypothetical protein